jgi:hypothetical protein
MTATPSASPARPPVKTPPSLSGAIAGLHFVCFGSLLCLSGSILLASLVMTELQLLREGEITEGVILNRHEESGEEGETYWVEYQLGPLLSDKSSHALHRNRAVVDGDTYSLSRPKSKVLIRYLPAAPEINRLDGQQPLIGYLVLLAFIGLFFALFLVFVVTSLQNLHDAILLARRGRQAMAQVVDKWVEACGDRNCHCVSYRFKADPSRRFVHYAAEDNDTAYHKLSVNDHVMVRFVPDRPEICRLKL